MSKEQMNEAIKLLGEMLERPYRQVLNKDGLIDPLEREHFVPRKLMEQALSLLQQSQLEKEEHDGDCNIYAALINNRPEDGICTCGYGRQRRREGHGIDDLYSDELINKLSKQSQPKCKTCGDTGIVTKYHGNIENGIKKVTKIEKFLCPDCQPSAQAGELSGRPSEVIKEIINKLCKLCPIKEKDENPYIAGRICVGDRNLHCKTVMQLNWINEILNSFLTKNKQLEQQLAETMEALNAQTEIYARFQEELDKHRWIPVSEKLPWKSGDYLTTIVLDGSRGTIKGKLSTIIDTYFLADSMWGCSLKHTHWKPIILPEEKEITNENQI